MTELQLRDALKALGMDRQSFRALPLLPLIQVAWADGQVQDEERTLILELARDKYKLNEEGMLLLRNWLQHPPSKEYVERGQSALVALCIRRGGSTLDRSILQDVLAFSQRVASAAGGLFGFGTVKRSESLALKQIAEALSIPAPVPWVAPSDQTTINHKKVDTGRVTVEFHTDSLQGIKSSGMLVQKDHIVGRQTCPITREGLIIGRWSESNIQISYDGTVSRRHCKVYEQDRKFYIEDQDSAQGTWVNGERILKRRLLGGEEIRIGTSHFQFELA